ncbi:uncharacterized protein ACA1_320810 [Acanthamoeba castellanii str. Neff]|uniref:PGM1 C-terminal domain-containing protein n=1 Tax=Acanthamoeba castellanii (strain ATCC 30010 / Neff) TaxID=1257118 RepID=L8GTZ1_ACACF|nr:uncharacterized protein ACA1_320810 [Acanthamoeba castellanii str. Neff]ELR16417.1 hypothetical protein ACA1_320810 [Acanthamoeba castellanii str. Neff]
MNSEVTRLPSHTAAAEPHVADGVANGQACPNNVDIHAVETAGYRAQRLKGVCFWPERAYEEVVVLPSITENAQALARTKGISFYEHRQLYHIALLRDPTIKRVIFLSSIPVDPAVVRYYWEVLLQEFVPFADVQERFVTLALDDPAVRPLSDKIQANPAFLSRVRDSVTNPGRCCLIPFVSTPAEHQVPYPFGTPLVRTEEELAASVFDLWRRGALVGPARRGGGHQQKAGAEEKGEAEEEQHLDRFVVKLDDSASGGGNALLDMRSVLRRCDLLEARNQLARSAADRPAFAAWLLSHRERITEEIANEFPRMAFQGRDEAWSTYRTEIPTQVLDGHVYQGCKFPCNHAYRNKIQEYTLRVGRVLADKGAMGHFGVDFLASCTASTAGLAQADSCEDTGQEWELFAVEINLREYDGTTGMLRTADGDLRYYVANDNVVSPRYTALSPASLTEAVAADALHFCPKRRTGVMFHFLSPAQEMGKVGIVCVGKTRLEAEDYATRARELLDRLAAGAAPSSSSSPSPTSPSLPTAVQWS